MLIAMTVTVRMYHSRWDQLKSKNTREIDFYQSWTADTDFQLVEHVQWQDLDTTAPPPDHY